MKVQIGHIYQATNDEFAGSRLFWLFQVVAKIESKQGAVGFVAIKLNTEPNSIDTIMMDQNGVEMEPFALNEPWRMLERSRAKPQYQVAL